MLQLKFTGPKTFQGRKSLEKVPVWISVLKLIFYKHFLSRLKRNREFEYSGIKIACYLSTCAYVHLNKFRKRRSGMKIK